MLALTSAPPLTDQRPASQEYAGKCLLTKRELAVALPMPTRTIDKLMATGAIRPLKISPRLVRFELASVLQDLRRFQAKR